MSSVSVVVSVFDSAVQAYSRPMFVPSRAYAVRAFSDEVNRRAPDNALSQHPEDYELRMLASFDEETGIFTAAGAEVIVRGKDVVKSVEK